MCKCSQDLLYQLFIWLSIFGINDLRAQEINKDYIYGCENCTITDFRALGRYKILFDYTRMERRMLILLDTQNLVVDRIQVDAPMTPCPYGEDGLLIPDLGYSAYLKIKNNTIEVEKLFQFQADFSQKYGSYWLVPPKKGFWSIGSRTCGDQKYISQFNFMNTNQKDFIAFMVKNHSNVYKALGKEIPVFSIKNYLENGRATVNDDLEKTVLVNKNCEEPIRATSGPGFHSYDIDGSTLMVFLRDFQKLYYIKLDTLPQVLGNIALPLTEPGRWRHFYDLAKHLSYFLFEKKEEVKKKSAFFADVKTYKLYRLDGQELTKVSEINYLPVDIEDNRLYELRLDKKSYHIYGHPLVPIKDDIQRIFIKPDGGR